MGLDWHTEEEETVWPKREGRRPLWLPPRPWGGGLGLVFLLLAAVGLGRWWENYTAAQEQQATAAVEASYHLLARATTQRDIELLRLVLSGRDSGWSYEQQSHLLSGQLLQRPFSGWVPLPSQEQVAVSLSGNWQAAEVSLTQSYHLSYETSPAIALRQQVFFERSSDGRWLYAPPPADFWGDPQTLASPSLTTTYPARDEALVRDLHGVVEEAFGRYCAELGRLCPPNAHIDLHLTSNPASLPQLFNGRRASAPSFRVELPTPSLIGQPVDEASQRALYGQYAAYLIVAANREWVIGRRMFADPLDMVLMDAQLSQLGLPPQLPPAEPLIPAFYDELLAYEAVWSVVSLPNEEQMSHRARQLLDFLAPLTAAHTPLDLQRLLTQPSFTAWLEQSTGLALWQIERAWERHVYEQTAVSARPTAPNYPNQVVGLLCTQSNQAVQYVTISHWDAPQWSASNTLGSAARYQFSHLALPADDGFVWQQMPLDPAENSWYSLLVYDDGQGFHLFDASNWRTPLAYTGWAHPSGRPLVMTSPDPELGFTQYHLLDPANCTAEGCPLTPSRGLPVWSPTGEYTLLTSFQGLHLGDGLGQRLARLESGTLPFWLVDDWYGYLRPLRLINEGGVMLSETAVVLARLDGQGAGREEVLTAADILAAVPPLSLPERLRYRTAQPLLDTLVVHPPTGTLYLRLHLHNQPETYIIAYQPATRRGELLFSTTAAPGRLAISPSGRWLTLTAFAPTSEGHRAHLYALDLAEGHTYRYTAELGREADTANWQADWSADEQWLIFTDEQSAHLVAPRQNYHQRLFHDYLTCGQAAWLNQ